MELRPELEPLPDKIAALPVHRGYPVPYFAEWLRDADGNLFPEFRATSYAKWKHAIREKKCWVCGQRLGAYIAFILGPMCGINRTTSEPPCHVTCAEWTVRNCPFLSRSNAVRRELPAEWNASSPGIALQRNPGVSMVWVTKSFTLFPDGKGGQLIEVGEPLVISYWFEGKPATRAQIDESIRTGLPSLRATVTTAREQRQLERQVTAFLQILPV